MRLTLSLMEEDAAHAISDKLDAAHATSDKLDAAHAKFGNFSGGSR